MNRRIREKIAKRGGSLKCLPTKAAIARRESFNKKFPFFLSYAYKKTFLEILREDGLVEDRELLWMKPYSNVYDEPFELSVP